MMAVLHSRLILACAFILCLGVFSELPPPERSYNILILSPISMKSHLVIFMPIAEGLAKRGHKVTILSNCYEAPPSPNITVLSHDLPYFKFDKVNMFERGNTYIELVKFLPVALWKFAGDFYKNPIVKKLYENRQIFDAVIIDVLINEVAYPFTYQKPFLTLCTTSTNDPIHSNSYGNTPNPAYVSSPLGYYQAPLTFLQRMTNYVASIFMNTIIRYLLTIAPVQYQISKQFPELPSLMELERNQSVAFINSHFTMYDPEPLLPGQVEVGCIQCRPAKPLPKDLADYVAGDVPVVYFSLGSETRLPDRHMTTFLLAFSNLPYKFVWKYHKKINNLPSNIIVRNELPQQDIVGHPNVKLFITHGGVLGTQEAIYHGTPMVAIPAYSDHPKTCQRIESKGLGIALDWSELTKQLLMDTIVEIIKNKKYKRRASEVSAVLRDQHSTPQERAVYWTEYVIRHRGAQHLRSAESDLTWIQVFHIDIMLAFALLAYILYKVMLMVLHKKWALWSFFRYSKINGKKYRKVQ